MPVMFTAMMTLMKMKARVVIHRMSLVSIELLERCHMCLTDLLLAGAGLLMFFFGESFAGTLVLGLVFGRVLVGHGAQLLRGLVYGSGQHGKA